MPAAVRADRRARSGPVPDFHGVGLDLDTGGWARQGFSMPAYDPAALVRAWLDAMNARDWDALFKHVVPDVVYEDMGAGERAQGRTAYQAVFQRYFDAAPDLHYRYETVTVGGNRVVLELVTEGTHTSPLVTAGGREIPPTGHPFSGRGAVVVDTDDRGRVVHVRHYTNPMSTLVQRGEEEPAG
jgi:steroid delta-isomerase-like uncharacterized protein